MQQVKVKVLQGKGERIAMNKKISAKEAVNKIKDGSILMLGGFLGCGSAHSVIDELANSRKRGFTVICNDGALPGGPLGEDFYGVAKLIHNRQVEHLIASHVGMNPEVAQQMNSGELKVTLLPQGSLAEMIRAGGAGLGGVITPTGYGTIVGESEFAKGEMKIEEKDYLVMSPLKADVAIISGYIVDEAGNVWYKGTTKNFNTVMATAADCVIVEADNIVETGQIEPENVMTPGVFVDYIVEGGAGNGTCADKAVYCQACS